MKEKIEKEENKEAEPVIKVLTPVERKRLLIEGIKKTAVPAIIGAVFAVILYMKFFDAKGTSWFSVLLLVALVGYVLQKALYPYIGVPVEGFETKDWFYVEIMTIIFMLVFWTLLLNVGTLDMTVTPGSLVPGTPGNVIANVTSSSLKIEGAAVQLSGEGVNASAVTGADGIANFYGVTAAGNLTITATKTGYIHNSTNITVRSIK